MRVRGRSRTVAVLVAAALASATGVASTACGGKTEPPPPIAAKLEGDVVAKVGSREIRSTTVHDIAVAQKVSSKEALDRAIFDALCAEEAEARGLSRGVDDHHGLVRVLLGELGREAETKGPIRRDELEELIARDWFKVARPESTVLVHVVVLVDAEAAPETWTRAFALADGIKLAIQPAADEAKKTPPPERVFEASGALVPDPSADRFVTLARERTELGLTTQAERLEPIAEDGKSVSPRGRATYDPEFVQRGLEARHRGDVVGPFKTSFGVHVAMSLGTLAKEQLTEAELFERYRAEAMDRRVRVAVDSALAAVGKSIAVEVPRSTDESLLEVKVTQ